MQKVLIVVRSTLVDLRLAIDGTIIMSENLRNALDCMYDSRIPNAWLKVCLRARAGHGRVLPTRRCASSVLAMCLSVCLSVTSRCSVETAEQIDLDFSTGAISSYPTLCHMGIRVSSKIRHFVWNVSSNSGLVRKIWQQHVTSVVNLVRPTVQLKAK